VVRTPDTDIYAAPGHAEYGFALARMDRIAIMKKLLLSSMLAGSLLSVPAAYAAKPVVLLNLVNQQPVSQRSFSLPFLAFSPSTYITFAGYHLPSFIQATNISVTQDDSMNLLAPSWTFVSAPVGSWADQLNMPGNSYGNESGTNGLEFGSVVIGSYDLFTQAIPTVVGTTYKVNFLYTQDYCIPNSNCQDNGFHTEVSDASPAPEGVPEPASWGMMILGFACAGAALRRRRQAMTIQAGNG
jgi:hypothetical protein